MKSIAGIKNTEGTNMPAKSKSQQRLFCMAYAVRHGKINRNRVSQSVLDLADSDMTDEQLKHFFILKESFGDSFDEKVEKMFIDAGYDPRNKDELTWFEKFKKKKVRNLLIIAGLILVFKKLFGKK